MDFNVYCDESCHLEHDGHPIMALGGIWCPSRETRELSRQIRRIKAKHDALGELKWAKVSPSRSSFYLELVDHFFATTALHFRCLIVEHKERLNHAQFDRGSHDAFYYKMYYYLLRNILASNSSYRVYLDIKDTRSQQKVVVLKDLLCSYSRNLEMCAVSNVQHIRSHESDLLQLADFLLGAVSSANRRVAMSETKCAVVNRISEHCRCSLTDATPPWEEKFNIFIFSPTEAC